jgi:hypothetical protein
VAEQSDAVYQDANTPTTAYIITNKPITNDDDAKIYVMIMNNGEIESEPYIGEKVKEELSAVTVVEDANAGTATPNADAIKAASGTNRLIKITSKTGYVPDMTKFANSKDMVVMIDYYTEAKAGSQQIEITPDKFGGNYYLEASTLFRDTNGVDMPAEFIIPNCKIQSNFTFTMASTGDPSTFTFTMDAFPDYTIFNKTKKVLAAIQIINESGTVEEVGRTSTHEGYTPNTTPGDNPEGGETA